jgi:hypothetical protein
MTRLTPENMQRRTHLNVLGTIVRLQARSLRVPMTRKAEAIKNYSRGVRAVQCIEVNTRDVIIQKIVTLFQRVLNADASDHFGIVLATL